jgi:N-acetylglucosamine-6-phosphate deacetylase
MSARTRHALAADTLFDGVSVRRDFAAVIEGERIAAVVPRRELPNDVAVRWLPDGAWLAPGFIDVQVNGGGDVLFNDEPSPAGIAAILAAHRRFGTTALLPTLITDTPEKMRKALSAVHAVVGRDPSVLGIHFEGPFLSPDRPGVHDPALIRAPGPDDVALLTSLRDGVTLLTLAPEAMPNGFVRALTAAGVRVSLGHSMATYEETRAAMADGLTGFTHLFNAMRPLAGREGGPIAAALESPGAYYGLIVDGEHVAPTMLRLALRGVGHPMLVTDAMPPVGGSRSSFLLYGHKVEARDGRCTRADGSLAGSLLDMATAVRNCVRLLDMPLPSAIRLATEVPARFLGVGDRLGRIAPGCRADMIALDPNEVRVLETWVAGKQGAGEQIGVTA